MANLNRLKEALENTWDKIRSSEAFQQIKSHYDDLDPQAKLYVHLGAIGGTTFLILLSVFYSMASLRSMQSAINEQEELIGMLNESAEKIRQLKQQTQTTRGSPEDATATVTSFVEGILVEMGFEKPKYDLSAEKQGKEEKEFKTSNIEVKLNQINLRQLTKFLFEIGNRGTSKNVTIENLVVDTKGDPNGYLDATVGVLAFKAK